jgi:hypothetical protein
MTHGDLLAKELDLGASASGVLKDEEMANMLARLGLTEDDLDDSVF